MKWIKDHKSELIIAGAVLFVLLFFALITKMTPLAGDDWGYAVQGMEANPFTKAWEFYFTWSGRFFSELWGFVVAPRKWLWNILNPALFALITFCIIKLTYKKNNLMLLIILVLSILFSVDNTLRIETYTWIMGTTYVVPLALLLMYLVLVKPIVFGEKKMSNLILGISIGLNFYIGLCMENATAILVLGNLLIAIYCWFNNKDYFKKSLLLLGVSIISLILIRVSPGATFRLARDNQEWIQLGLFNQIGSNWVTFLQRTFIYNRYMMMILSITMILGLLSFNKSKKWSISTIIMLIMHGLCFVLTFVPTLYDKTNLNFLLVFYDVEFTSTALLFCSIFYLAYVGILFWQMVVTLDLKQRLEGSFYLMLAGTANIAMLLSPIFGARSSIYTVFFIIVLIAFMIANIEINQYIQFGLVVLFVAFIMIKCRSLFEQYKIVQSVQNERDSIIEYYRVNQDEKEAWIPRMPTGFIHSADIEEGDDYHMEVFKEYYGLNPDVKLVFFKK
ncbi:DUF6056 family protein [Anaerorhabdus sp.]|uniref:DUF6056 family protein n=1 Tax=Anaerorhabdus sp. TaxID=1872524 RepID=UPI002FC6B26A